jgi:hypothetical protein
MAVALLHVMQCRDFRCDLIVSAVSAAAVAIMLSLTLVPASRCGPCRWISAVGRLQAVAAAATPTIAVTRGAESSSRVCCAVNCSSFSRTCEEQDEGGNIGPPDSCSYHDDER